MTRKLNIKCWGPKDRTGKVIKRADTVIVYKPNGSTDTIWLSARVSNVQTDKDRVCVLCGDGNYHYFAPEDIRVIMRSSSTSVSKSSAVMRIKKEYKVRDVVGSAVKLDRHKSYCCTIKDYVEVLKRGVKDDLELIRLIEEYGNNMYMPISPLINELNLYAEHKKLSPVQRFYNMVSSAADRMALMSRTRSEQLVAVSVSDHCKKLLQTLTCVTTEEDERVFSLACTRARTAADLYVSDTREENRNTKQSTGKDI